VFWGEFAKREPKANGAMLAELFGWLAAGKLRPHVSKTFSLHDVPLALRSLLDRTAVGKLVVVPSK
jgi:NADPH2:quinone reductase